MTGPEHYREAERILRQRGLHPVGGGFRGHIGPTEGTPGMAAVMAEAQVHATLALAAATAMAGRLFTKDGDPAWHEAANT